MRIGKPLRRSGEQQQPFDKAAFDKAEAEVLKKARGAIAPAKMAECIRASTVGTFKDGEVVERKNFMERPFDQLQGAGVTCSSQNARRRRRRIWWALTRG